MTESPFIKGWRRRLAGHDHGLHLADPAHALEMYVGKTDQGKARLVIHTKTKAPKPKLSGLVLVEQYQDEGSNWNLSFTLQDGKFLEPFLRLADAVFARSADAHNEAAALDRVLLVIEQWRRLLNPRPVGVLTMEELRGLLGELWLVAEEFAHVMPVNEAVEGWLGPMGMPQDFWYPLSGYHEAKAVGPAETRVKISSESQLDASPLELLVLHVANTAEGTVGALSLPMLVNRLHAEIHEKGGSPDGLNERLARHGVELDNPFYRDTWFLVSRLDVYSVTPEFPAVRASELDPRVAGVTYQIELAGLAEFLNRTVDVM